MSELRKGDRLGKTLPNYPPEVSPRRRDRSNRSVSPDSIYNDKSHSERDHTRRHKNRFEKSQEEEDEEEYKLREALRIKKNRLKAMNMKEKSNDVDSSQQLTTTNRSPSESPTRTRNSSKGSNTRDDMSPNLSPNHSPTRQSKPIVKNLNEMLSEDKPKEAKPSKYHNLEKDPKVEESIEDSRKTDKLQAEREKKRMDRENRAKLQTEATNRIEEAIERVENATEDGIRYNSLKEKSDKLNYNSKPDLNKTKVILSINKQQRPVTASATSKTLMNRTRSLSGSSNMSADIRQALKDKYSSVKPKTITRITPDTERGPDSTRKDSMNDSASIM
jgi:hypothetical protein